MPSNKTRTASKAAAHRGSAAPRSSAERQDYKDFYGGLIRLHVLHHAARGPVFGLWLIEELRHHGYRVGPGKLYPLLHSLERRGLLRSEVTGRGRTARRLYVATRVGRATLARAKEKVRELFGEIFEEHA